MAMVAVAGTVAKPLPVDPNGGCDHVTATKRSACLLLHHSVLETRVTSCCHHRRHCHHIQIRSYYSECIIRLLLPRQFLLKCQNLPLFNEVIVRICVERLWKDEQQKITAKPRPQSELGRRGSSAQPLERKSDSSLSAKRTKNVGLTLINYLANHNSTTHHHNFGLGIWINCRNFSVYMWVRLTWKGISGHMRFVWLLLIYSKKQKSLL